MRCVAVSCDAVQRRTSCCVVFAATYRNTPHDDHWTGQIVHMVKSAYALIAFALKLSKLRVDFEWMLLDTFLVIKLIKRMEYHGWRNY